MLDDVARAKHAEILVPIASHASIVARGGALPPLIVTITRGKIVHPTVSTFAAHHGHPGVAYLPIVDMPAAVAALIWRRDASTPALREFVDVAQRAAPAA